MTLYMHAFVGLKFASQVGLKLASQLVTLRGVVEGGFTKKLVFHPGDAAQPSATAHTRSSRLTISKSEP